MGMKCPHHPHPHHDPDPVTLTLTLTQANSEASKGEYTPGSQPSIEESLFVKNYAY